MALLPGGVSTQHQRQSRLGISSPGGRIRMLASQLLQHLGTLHQAGP